MGETLKLLSLFQVEEEIKSDLYILFFHIVQRIPEYLIHLQVGPKDGNCLVELLLLHVTFNSRVGVQAGTGSGLLANPVGSLRTKNF